MNNEIRAKRLAELLGMEVPEEFKAPPEQEARNYEQETNSREAEAVLLYIDDSRKFLQRECKNCGFTFAVNRGNVAYCSDICRKHSLEKIGISWDASKNPADRWDFKEPLVVPPLVLPHLTEIADQVLQQRLDSEAQQSAQKATQDHEAQADELNDLLADLQID